MLSGPCKQAELHSGASAQSRASHLLHDTGQWPEGDLPEWPDTGMRAVGSGRSPTTQATCCRRGALCRWLLQGRADAAPKSILAELHFVRLVARAGWVLRERADVPVSIVAIAVHEESDSEHCQNGYVSVGQSQLSPPSDQKSKVCSLPIITTSRNHLYASFIAAAAIPVVTVGAGIPG